MKASLDSGELLAQATGSGAVPRSPGARVWPWAVAALAMALLVAGGIYALVQRRAQPATSASAFSLENLQVTQLTSTGNASRPAISPDGKYVVYVEQDGGDSSLWVRQTASSSNVQIVRAEPGVSLWGGTVTPDGAFVDFIRWRQPQNPELWRVPFLGGTPKRVMDDVWTPISWSPDGQHLAFVRSFFARLDLARDGGRGWEPRTRAGGAAPAGFYRLAHHCRLPRTRTRMVSERTGPRRTGKPTARGWPR